MFNQNKDEETKTRNFNRGKSMRRTVKRKLTFMMAVMMIALSFAGCGDKKKETNAKVEDETTTEVSGNEEGAFDFSQVFDNIEINGKPVPFPFAVNELGDEYTIDYINEMGDGTCGASLLYEGQIIATLDYVGDKKEDIDRNTVCCGINIGSRGQEIYINGINCNSSLEDVEQHFIGLPRHIDEKGNIIGSGVVDEEKGLLILITYEEDLGIRTIYINGVK